MKIQIRHGNVEVTEAIRAHVEHRLRYALGRFGTIIQSVIVRLSDVGGEMRCSLEVRPGGVKVDDVDIDLSVAIDHASARVSRAVARELEKER